MIFRLIEGQIGNVVKLSDIVLKSTGLNNIDMVSKVINLMDNPYEKEEGHVLYEMNDEQLDSVYKVLDLSVRCGGVNVISGVKELLELFNNPLEVVEEVEEDIIEEEIDEKIEEKVEEKVEVLVKKKNQSGKPVPIRKR